MNCKLFIATPAFEGKTHLQYALSLAETASLCKKNHIEIQYCIVASGSLLCAERNRLVEAFLHSDCTHMLCIDSDLGWAAEAVLGILKKDVSFVGGCYPARTEKSFLFRPCLNEDQSLVVDKEKGLIKMEHIPAGFILIRREVLEKMVKDYPERRFVPKDGKPSGSALFNTEMYEGEFWGEDYVFCRLLRQSGFEIWVDPMIQFDHGGNIGVLASALTDKRPEQQ
jgi:hypothetical protein